MLVDPMGLKVRCIGVVWFSLYVYAGGNVFSITCRDHCDRWAVYSGVGVGLGMEGGETKTFGWSDSIINSCLSDNWWDAGFEASMGLLIGVQGNLSFRPSNATAGIPATSVGFWLGGAVGVHGGIYGQGRIPVLSDFRKPCPCPKELIEKMCKEKEAKEREKQWREEKWQEWRKRRDADPSDPNYIPPGEEPLILEAY
jgi:hypothetical protein